MKNNYQATTIGFIYSITSFILGWTFIVPLLTILPAGLFLEGIFNEIYSNRGYEIVGRMTFLTLIILFLVISSIYFFSVAKQASKFSNFNLALYYIFISVQVFIVHPLGFYLYLSQNWGRAGDGQLLLGVVETFPYSSFAFLFLGIITDLLKNKYAVKNTYY